MNERSVSDAAMQLRVSSDTVRRWIARGKLPATRRGRFLRIRQSDIDRLAKNGRDATGPSTAGLRPGSPAALLHYLKTGPHYATPEDVRELERLIAEGRRQARQQAETR